MDDEELLAAVAGILWPDLRELTCREHGQVPGHVCLPVSGRADLGNLVETLSDRYGQPLADADRLPPLPLSGPIGWRYAWPFSNRWVAFGQTGQGHDARPALMIALRGTPVPEQLPAEASWLERLVAVTGWVPRAAYEVDWAAVESRLGTRLPSDYKALVRAFGHGMFDGFHCVCMPDELIKRSELEASLPQARWEPYPPFPAPGGLLPWMGNEHEQTFHWITEGPDPDAWPVYVTGADPEAGDRFDCTATEYLFRHLTDPQHPIPMPVDFRAHWFMDCG
ncbi:SMI1/KNR4 family protein [Streptomyces chattanoogensis]|uniref:SMI1/KNR4 family protein n=1 Tax=Streptomyces chattanoogensis TaxID=66876 RepID=UPI0006B56383|nr:SMI1/KNR4 family protein [Streptomyces chattanoogensis]